MIVSHETFMYICSVMVAALAAAWLIYDIYLLTRSLPKGRAAHDQIFGSIVGLVVSLIGLLGVVRFHLGG